MKMNHKVKKIGWLEDAVHLAANTGIVYLGIAGVHACREGINFFEELRDPGVLRYTLLGGGLIVGYKIARRVHYYLQCRKEQNENRSEK